LLQASQKNAQDIWIIDLKARCALPQDIFRCAEVNETGKLAVLLDDLAWFWRFL